MTRKPEWSGAAKPTVEEFEALLADAVRACEHGAAALDLGYVSAPDRSDRRVIEEMTQVIERVIDAVRDLDMAINVSMRGCLPVNRPEVPF